jgi:uncharacterized protein YwgA
MTNKCQEFADGTAVYSFDDLQNHYPEFLSKKNIVLVRDVILLLLSIIPDKPIFGRTMVMKQIFLTYEEIFNKQEIQVQNPKFVPYDYGPYSFLVTQIISDLSFSGFIIVNGKKNSNKESFSLNPKYQSEIENIIKKIPPELLTEIKEKRIGWDQFNTQGILNYVYDNFPNMKEKSKVKNLYGNITWGLGKG